MRQSKTLAATLALGLAFGISFLGAGPASAEPIVSLDDPGITTSDIALAFSGTTEAELDEVTVYLPGGEAGSCDITPNEGTWTCDYTPTAALQAGTGTLHFEFVDAGAPEDETFTIAEPDAVVTLDPPTAYETGPTITLTGTTNFALSSVVVTAQGSAPQPCVLASAGPGAWECTIAGASGFALGAAGVDYSLAGTSQTVPSASFDVVAATTFSGTGDYYSAATSAVFSGTTVTPVTAASVEFADDTYVGCPLDVSPAGSWSCTYSSPGGLPVGPAHVELDFGAMGIYDSHPFVVHQSPDYDALPATTSPVFGPGTASIAEALTGAADHGTTGLYDLSDTDGGPALTSSCDIATVPTCTVAVAAGVWELRSSQGWTSGPTNSSSSSFRVPDAPSVNIEQESNNVVALYGYGTGGDLVTVSGSGGELCSVEALSTEGEGDGYWECILDPLAEGVHGFSVTETDQGAGEPAAEDFAYEWDLDAIYVNGGTSVATTVSFALAALPDVDYDFFPGRITVTGTPTGGSSVVGVALLDDGGTAVESCGGDLDDPYASPLAGLPRGVDTCSFLVGPGTWTVTSQQDTDDGETPNGAVAARSFVVPATPAAPSASDNGNGTITLSGAGAHAGDLVRVILGNTLVCSAMVQGPGTWSCTTSALGAGSYGFRAVTEDGGVWADGEQPLFYAPGGVSSPSATTAVTIRVPAGGGTPPSSPTTPTTPVNPGWSFILSGLNLAHVHPGDHFTIHGTGLPAGSTVSFELHSTPVSLGSTTVAPDGSYSLSGTIPASTVAGAHHIVATLTGAGIAPSSADQGITVEDVSSDATSSTTSGGGAAEGNSSGDSNHEGGIVGDPNDAADPIAPNVLTNGLNSIGDVFVHPEKVPSALAVGLVLLIFAVLPAHLLNATIAEQYDNLVRRVPRLGRTPRWLAGLRGWLGRAPVLGGLAITTVTALLFGFADPRFGFTLASLRLFLAVAIALFVVVYLANAIAGRVVSKNWNVDVKLSIRPLGLVLTVIGVLVSRALEFSPGFLIGLVLGLTIAGKSAASHAWKAVLIRSGVVIAVALAAWIGYSAFPAGEHEGSTFLSELALETLVAITTEGIVTLLVELLPIHLLEGERLYAHSRVLWAAVYLALVVIFIVAVVPWEGNWAELGSSLWSWLAVVVIFGIVCVGIYLFFRIRSRNEHEELAGEELVSVSDNE